MNKQEEVMHDKARVTQDLHESLSLDKHPVAILLGAGCPQAVRVIEEQSNLPLIPDVVGLTNYIKDKLKDNKAFTKLLSHFSQDDRHDFTIEDILSHVRLLSRIAGRGDARGINKADLGELESVLCAAIATAVDKCLPTKDSPYHLLAQWIRGVRRNTPVTLFTTNYDLLMEQALEEEYIPYFDGFVGSRNPFFDVSAIEEDSIPARWTRLWKLHGSINWKKSEGNDGVVVRSHGASAKGGVLIHPSEMKYDQSRKMPYLAMIDRLKQFLRHPSALVTIGYSFSDEHLNDVLIHAAKNNPTSVIFGLLYKDLKDEPGIKKISENIPLNMAILARDQGIFRGQAGPWLEEVSGERKQDAKLELGDFAKFGRFLQMLSRERGGKTGA